jgi:hypothetical protein
MTADSACSPRPLSSLGQLSAIPTDVLRHYIFSGRFLDPLSLVVCRFVCRRIKDLAPPPAASTASQIRRNKPLMVPVCVAAAARGFIPILRWARSKGYPPYCATVAHYAAMGGHLDLLQWARDTDGCWSHETAEGAAQGGAMDVLRWLAVEDGVLGSAL